MTDAHAIPHGGGSRPNALAIWYQSVRAWSFTATATPALVGAAVALHAGYFSIVKLLLVLLGVLAIQSGTNLINDYYDYVSGADAPGILGPSMVIQDGLLTPDQVWWGGIVAMIIGSVFGLVLVAMCGWPILLVGVASVAAAYFYTAAPVAFGYHGLGDFFEFLFMGPIIVVATCYVMTLSFSWAAFLASLPVGFAVLGILHTNNMRDMEVDRTHGKWTFAAIIGRERSVQYLLAMNVAIYATALIGVFSGLLPWTMLVVLVTAPRAIKETRMAWAETDHAKLHTVHFLSVRLQLEVGILSILAFLVAALAGL